VAGAVAANTNVTATVNYANTLNTPATGLTSSNGLTADIYVVWTEGGADRQLKVTPNIKDCACCGVLIAPGVFKEFLCHNLGADTSLDPDVPVSGIFGHYYQWGFKTHVADVNTTILTPPGWNNTTYASTDAWLDASKTVDDPCPAGYKVPSKTQWEGVIANNTVSRIGPWYHDGFYDDDDFSSVIHYGPFLSAQGITLPANGYRLDQNGLLYYRGLVGRYWASTSFTDFGDSRAHYVQFTGDDGSISSHLALHGMSVRCISE
jgi:uncharacterized protein (TIGR02145 family)